MVSHLYTLLVVLIGWVFFYFTDLSRAMTVLGRMIGIGAPAFGLDALSGARMMNHIFFLAAAIFGCLPVWPRLRDMLTDRRSAAYAPGVMIAWEIAVCVVLLIACTALLVGESYNPFLYFRF